MHCVLWTYAVPPHLDEQIIRTQFAVVAESTEGRIVVDGDIDSRFESAGRALG
jgi:hypothetical protein